VEVTERDELAGRRVCAVRKADLSLLDRVEVGRVVGPGADDGVLAGLVALEWQWPLHRPRRARLPRERRGRPVRAEDAGDALVARVRSGKVHSQFRLSSTSRTTPQERGLSRTPQKWPSLP